MSVLDSFSSLSRLVEESSDTLDALARRIETGDDQEAAGEYLRVWQHVHETATSAAVDGLPEVTEFVKFNAERLAEACLDSSPGPGHVQTMQGFVAVFRRFVDAPHDAEALGELIVYLQGSGWPVSMGDDQAYSVMGRLLEQLQDPESDNSPPETASAREAGGETAMEYDAYRVALPADAHPQLVEAFFNEVPQLAEEFSQHIQNLAGGGADHEDLLKAQRLSHTIKGSANVTGVLGVANLMHGCEDLLESLSRQQALPDKELAGLLMETADCLAAQLEYLQGRGPTPEQTRELAEALKAWQPEGSTAAPVSAPAAGDGSRSSEPASADAASQPETMRVSATRIEDLLRQAGEVSISTVQLLGLSQSLDNRLSTLIKQQSLLWERLSSLQELVEQRSVGTVRSMVGGVAAGSQFDSLEMDEYNELYSAASFLAESIMDSREYTSQIRDDFNRMRAMLKQQDVLSRELSENVMGARMVPFRSIASRLERVVRQTSRTTGKTVSLNIEGGDVQVDRTVLDRLTDPLMHLLRNAVDHGLETPRERNDAGKPETGRIDLSVERQGDNVALTVRDDGRGLDFERIRQLAGQRGLLQGDGAGETEESLARLVLLPGFSTREETTQISGRGIGMDVVNSAVIEQRGTMQINSELDRGLEVHIRVPMSLISVHTLLLKNAGVVLGVPSSSVQQLIFSDLGKWKRDGGEQLFEFEDRDHRVTTLSGLIGVDASATEIDENRPLPLLLVQGEREPYAVVLEEMLDNRYLVVKQLGRYVPRIQGVIGGAILGDGSVAAVVDIRELLRQRSDTGAAPLRDIGRQSQAEIQQELPAVLVVDDSVSARRALSELVSDAGYRSESAVDGLDALAIINKEKPAAILVDMEMPRMNGIELAAHLKANAETAQIPLIMITSRSADKHRRQAKQAGVDLYFTKPYSEDRLVEELHALIR